MPLDETKKLFGGRHAAAEHPAEVRAFPDVPGGVINVPTERTAERSRLGWPRDVNTFNPPRCRRCRGAVEGDRMLTPDLGVRAFLETKTVQHPRATATHFCPAVILYRSPQVEIKGHSRA